LVSGISVTLAELLDFFVKATFGHHGVPPYESPPTNNIPYRRTAFFDEVDIDVAKRFCLECYSILGDSPNIPDQSRKFKKVLKEASWSFAGIAVISDWLGSNVEFFPYHSLAMPLVEYWSSFAIPQAEKALLQTGWRSHTIRSFSGIASMQSLFPFIEDPTPLQALTIDVPLFGGPKMFIIEDTTGAGKTEAATVLSARIMSTGEADGIYVGLPTMATANAMYERMQAAYLKLYADGEHPSLVLSHGSRHLSPDFSKTVVVAEQIQDRFYGTEETASAMCNVWYADNRKKALLADIGIGTIDQALLAILPAKHQSLRLLGLHRKILIVDEVHAYDSYMEHLIEVLLEAHARGGGSVILLSATIPLATKHKLIQAFRNGLMGATQQNSVENQNAFPLLTQVAATKTESYVFGTRKEMKRRVRLDFFYSYLDVLRFIEESAEAGKCVCWIRNTVADARKAFNDLRVSGKVAKERLVQFHSRFAMIDRVRIEKKILSTFGRNSSAESRKGRVTIATQVVEQSLDLDFDVMVVDLSPIDLIIQRAGRLHRHVRDEIGNIVNSNNVEDGRGEPVLHIYAPNFREDADSQWLQGDFAGTAAVYRNPGVLWKTQKKLLEKGEWRMPEDARTLIEEVYGEEQSIKIPDGLDFNVTKAIGVDASRKGMADLNALDLEVGYRRDPSKPNLWNEDEKIATRLSDESTEVVLCVLENEKLMPYAEIENHPWDWSCLSVSKADWVRTGYSIPEHYSSQVEILKADNSRLRYTEVVIVSQRSIDAIQSEKPISNIYDPHLGWGMSFHRGGMSESDTR